MSQGNNAIADQLRQLADRIERSPTPLHMQHVRAGGERRSVNVSLEARVEIPGGLSPGGLSIFIGEKEFVCSSMNLFFSASRPL